MYNPSIASPPTPSTTTSTKQHWVKYSGNKEDFAGWRNSFISAIATYERQLFDPVTKDLIMNPDSDSNMLLYTLIINSLPLNDRFREADDLLLNGRDLWSAINTDRGQNDSDHLAAELLAQFLQQTRRGPVESIEKYSIRFSSLVSRIRKYHDLKFPFVRRNFLSTLGEGFDF